MLSRTLERLAPPGDLWNDRDTRVLHAVLWLERLDPPVTTAKIDRYLGIARDRVMRSIRALEAAGLIATAPGRPRTITAAVVPLPVVALSGLSQPERLAVLRDRQRASGSCPHPLPVMIGTLCAACGEIVLDADPDTPVSSTPV